MDKGVSVRVVNNKLGFILLFFSFRFLYFILNLFFLYFNIDKEDKK